MENGHKPYSAFEDDLRNIYELFKLLSNQHTRLVLRVEKTEKTLSDELKQIRQRLDEVEKKLDKN